MKKYMIMLTGCLLVSISCFAQSDREKEVTQVIQDIFDGMRAGDSARVANHFERSATMFSVFTDKSGASVLRPGSLQEWLNAIGTPREDALDERLWDIEVRIDGDLATVWTMYALYVGKNYSHCGVDAFQLRHDGNDWKVFHVADTRRQKCDIPENVKNQ